MSKQILDELREFVQDEQEANLAKLFEVWEKPLSKKLISGESQLINEVKIKNNGHLLLSLGEGESRFREGDMICLHMGNALESSFVRQATIESEYDNEWLIRVFNPDMDRIKALSEICYADPDGMDLKPFFDKSLDDIAMSGIGTKVILPLLSGELDASHIYTDNYDEAADFAEEEGLNEQQANAVGMGVASQYLACI